MNEINLEYKNKYLKYKKKYLSLKNEVGGSSYKKWKWSCRFFNEFECNDGRAGKVYGINNHDCIYVPEDVKIGVKKVKKGCHSIGNIIDGYTKNRLLGEGSYGSVYLIDQNTVVKVINHKKLDEDGKKRLLSEINILRKIKYPFATHLKKDTYDKDYYKYNNKSYLIMNKLPGMELFDYFNYLYKKKKKLDDNKKKYLIVQMILFNYYNHINKVIHLDLKPENYYFDEKTNKLYILDYGLAACFKGSNICESGDRNETEGFTEIARGTPDYYPPSMNNYDDKIYTKYLDDYFIISIIIFADLFNSNFKNNHFERRNDQNPKKTNWIAWKEEYGHKNKLIENRDHKYPEYKEDLEVVENNKAYKLFEHYVLNYIDIYNKHQKQYYDKTGFDFTQYHRSNVKTALGFFGINKNNENLIAALEYIDEFHKEGFDDNMKTKEDKLWEHITKIVEQIQLYNRKK
jgi:serine/threonine protein kinase